MHCLRLKHKLPIDKSIFTRLLSTSEYHDVIISGGGLIGGSMACALGLSPKFAKKKILLLEAQPDSTSVEFSLGQPFSNRVCAISPTSRDIMKDLNIWDTIERKRFVKKMQVWDAMSKSSIIFDEDNMSGDLCYIIENNLIISAITRVLHKLMSDHFQISYSSRITDVVLPKNYTNLNRNEPSSNARITLESGQQLECNLLIAADGAQSTIPGKCNLQSIGWQYGQSGIVATLKFTEPCDNVVAWQRFLPEGPIALLPLDENHSSLVWSTTHELANEIMSLSDEEFVERINNAFCMSYEQPSGMDHAEIFLEKVLSWSTSANNSETIQLPPCIMESCGNRGRFPLGLSHSNHFVMPRLALIGDSAHRIHPLAGQGANLGFGDVSCLLKVLNQAVYDGKDIGCLSRLLRYESESQARSAVMCAVTDGLNKLYSTNATPIVTMRSIGMQLASSNQTIKKTLMKRAMG